MQKQQEIKKIVSQIVENYKPEKVILFGSYANGKPRVNSDIDLAVIKKTNESFVERLKKMALVVKTWESLDILVYTPQEWQEALARGHYFIKEIAATGKTLYEKPAV